ncbi:MAG: FtsQ-type POTRA domain-containing protein [Alphaproteobacteria bacterium]|nr:FtsQ-type POTRA domain-containing protein [Alphaproteobacteria bacterium]
MRRAKPVQRKKSKRSIIRRKNTSAERIIIFARRFGIIAAALVFLGWVGSWFFLSDAAYHTGQWARDKVLNVTADAGFVVEDLLVEGRTYTDSDAIMAIANVAKGDPLFSFDAAAAQSMIERLSWVEAAKVTRRLPDTIHIELTEREPFALWQHQGRVRLIDDEGEVLTDHKLSRFSDLLIVVGKDAPIECGSFLALLSAEPLVREKVESAMHVAGRRWDLTLKNGVTVKLPERNASLALSTLARAQADDALLDKDIKMIDMREQARIVIRTKPGAVQEYKASYNSDGSSGDSI